MELFLRSGHEQHDENARADEGMNNLKARIVELKNPHQSKSHNYQPRRLRRCKQPMTLRTWPAALFVFVAQVLRMAGGGSVAPGLKAYLHCVGAQRRGPKLSTQPEPG